MEQFSRCGQKSGRVHPAHGRDGLDVGRCWGRGRLGRGLSHLGRHDGIGGIGACFGGHSGQTLRASEMTQAGIVESHGLAPTISDVVHEVND